NEASVNSRRDTSETDATLFRRGWSDGIDVRGGVGWGNGRFARLEAALHIVGEELAEAGVAEGLAVRALHEVEVRALVALDQARAVVEDGDVPADDDVVAESGGMGAAGEVEHLQPEPEVAAEDLAAGLR